MIDLSSKDCSYTTLKVNEIIRLLKEIKPDIIELTPSDVINISLITFAYLIECNFFDEDVDGDLRLTMYDDVIHINVEEVTMQLKFKNTLVNEILEQKPISEVSLTNTVKELFYEGDL